MIQTKFGRVRNAVWIIGLLAVLQGCTPGVFPSADVESKEPNNNFDQAQPVQIEVLQTVDIAGSLSSQNDLDVFSLGELTEGETIAVSIRSSNMFFSDNLSLVIFDGDLDAANAADVIPSTIFEEAMTHIVRKPGEYYLAIYQSESGSTNYDMQVTLGSGSVPEGKFQSVYLNFNGVNSIEIGGTLFRNLEPLSAVNLSINAQAAAAEITQLVRNAYGDLDISFISSYDASAPTEPHSTVYITGSTGDFFGLANDIDWYNQIPDDNAVVFAGLLAEDTSSTSRFPQLTANVVAHETGHLLGLIHTDDNTELMDISTPTFLLEMQQDFHRAPLAAEEFPIGWEDTWELLDFTLGIL